MLERGMSTQGAFDHFVTGKAKKNQDDNEGNETNTTINANKRGFNKTIPEGLIGKADTKKKEIVILSKKSVEESANDYATQTKKVVMKDFLALLKEDPRLAHKPLTYRLQNKAQWPIQTHFKIEKMFPLIN